MSEVVDQDKVLKCKAQGRLVVKKRSR